MSNRWKLFFILLAGTAVLLFANIYVQKGIAGVVKENKLVDEDSVEEGMSPTVAFSVMALGGFRGLLADILWIRAGDLQQKGRYYELAQLSKWILTLQPKFPTAAAYMGWNMAYNISVTCKRPEDRWRWVRRGIQLMQDAVNMNPNDPNVYHELAWIYQHKLGNVLDDAQQYYKETMARELIFVYGKHYPDWEAWSASPATEKALRERFPEDGAAWRELMAYQDGKVNLDRLFGEFRLNGGLPKELKEKLDPEDASALDYYFRRKWLKQDWYVEPETILAINREYGELDWLLPESYAVYWSYDGLRHSPDRENVPLTRLILQSLVASFNYGRMLLPKEDEVSKFFLLVPNTGVIDAARDLYKKVLQQEEYSHVTFDALYENFLIDSIVTLYAYSQKEAAAKLFQELRTVTTNKNAPKMTLDQFVLNEWEDDIASGDFKQTGNEIEGLIFSACLLLGYGDRDTAVEQLALAARVYSVYQKQHEGYERVELPSFSEMKARTARAIIENYPPEIADRVRAELQEDLKKLEQAESEKASGSGAEQEAAGQ